MVAADNTAGTRVVPDFGSCKPGIPPFFTKPAKSGSGQISSRICRIWRMPAQLQYVQLTTDQTNAADLCSGVEQSCSVDATKYYLTNRVINDWNSLPSDIISSPTVTTFKLRLLQHDISSYLIMFTV